MSEDEVTPLARMAAGSAHSTEDKVPQGLLLVSMVLSGGGHRQIVATQTAGMAWHGMAWRLNSSITQYVLSFLQQAPERAHK